MTEKELLRDGERIDDLQCNGFRIIQDPSQFCFGMDAVLLADFAAGRKKAAGMDLGTGTGIIPLLMLAKNKAWEFTALEIQPEMADMAERSAKLNDVSGRMTVVWGDICNIDPVKRPDEHDAYGSVERNSADEIMQAAADPGKEKEYIFEICRRKWRGAFDIVTSNPPYIADTGGLHNPRMSVNIARHEIAVKLEDVVRAAAFLLKTGGSFAMVHKPFRLIEITELLRKYKLEPKRMQLVQPRDGSEPNMLLIESVKGGNLGVRILPTLNVYGPDGAYTEELLRYYNS